MDFALPLYLTEPGKGRALQYLSLLWLAVCYYGTFLLLGNAVAAGFAFLSWLAIFLWIKKRWPSPRMVAEGALSSKSHELQLLIHDKQQVFQIDETLQITITYQGFRGEQLAPRIWASGFDNFIQFNDGETYRFEMPTEQAQENLRGELRRWYLLKVRLKEHRRDGPTFLLHRDLSYEQIQAYKQEFGVSLYG